MSSKIGEKILEEYYTANFDKLVMKQTRRSGTPENAEDIVQDAFVRALKYIDQYNPAKPFEGWFVSILNNSFRDFMRDERNYGMCMEYKDEEHYNDEDAVLSADVKDLIEKEIAARKRPLRDVLFLYFLRQYKPSEIAQVLGLHDKTIMNNIAIFKGEMVHKLGES